MVLHDLASLSKSNITDTTPIRLHVSWNFEPSCNYYRVTKNLTWLSPVDREDFKPEDDYFYIYKDELTQLTGFNYTILKEYPTNTLLIKNIHN